MLRQRQSGGRRAVTLIELLVVISIIAVLAGLTLAGVMRVRGAAVRAENKDRMLQIETAANKFVSGESYGRVGYLPNAPFNIKKTYAATDPEVNYLSQVFPRINTGNTGASADVTLPDGNAVAMFFLTGSTVTKYEGFSNNPQQPFLPKGSNDETRKVEMKGVPTKWISADGLHFVDPYGTPYVIFLPNKQGNYTNNPAVSGVSPYKRGTATPAKFENPKSIQIISAGFDKKFGLGGDWSTGVNADGRDDVSNFSTAEHSSGPQ